MDTELEKSRAMFNKEFFLGTGKDFVRVEPDDKRIVKRADCSGCMANYNYAKKHNKLVIYNLYTEDIIGVCIDD